MDEKNKYYDNPLFQKTHECDNLPKIYIKQKIQLFENCILRKVIKKWLKKLERKEDW